MKGCAWLCIILLCTCETERSEAHGYTRRWCGEEDDEVVKLRGALGFGNKGQKEREVSYKKCEQPTWEAHV